MPCLRTQHGSTRVALKPPTSGSGVRGINHQATVLPSGWGSQSHSPLFSSRIKVIDFRIPSTGDQEQVEVDVLVLGAGAGSTSTS